MKSLIIVITAIVLGGIFCTGRLFSSMVEFPEKKVINFKKLNSRMYRIIDCEMNIVCYYHMAGGVSCISSNSTTRETNYLLQKKCMKNR